MIYIPEGKYVIGSKRFTKPNTKNMEQFRIQSTASWQKLFTMSRINFNMTFAPIAWMKTARIVLTSTTQMKVPDYQFDIKSAILNGKLKDEVYEE